MENKVCYVVLGTPSFAASPVGLPVLIVLLVVHIVLMLNFPRCMRGFRKSPRGGRKKKPSRAGTLRCELPRTP
eukprot:4546995-Amphidinium_carterae.2